MSEDLDRSQSGPSTTRLEHGSQTSCPEYDFPDPNACLAEDQPRRRLKPKPLMSLGLEDEVDFTSEDLISERGEIIPENPGWLPPLPRAVLDPLAESRLKGTLSKKEQKAYEKQKKALDKEDKARQKADRDQDKLLAQSRLVPPEEWEMRSMGSSEGSMGKGASTTSLTSSGRRGGSLLRVWQLGRGRREKLDVLPVCESEESFGSASKSVPSSRRASYILDRPTMQTEPRRSSFDSLDPIDTSPFTYSPRLQTPRQREVSPMTGTSTLAESPIQPVSIGPTPPRKNVELLEMDTNLQTILSAAYSYKAADFPSASSSGLPGSRAAFTSPTMAVAVPVAAVDHPLGLITTRSSQSSDVPPVVRTDRPHFPTALLPAFPVSAPDRLTFITTLSTSIWKQSIEAVSTPEKGKSLPRPATSSSVTGFGVSKFLTGPTWTCHRLILTQFKLHDVKPLHPIHTVAVHHRELSTQTVAHLHVFPLQSLAPSALSRPATATGAPQFGSVNRKRPGTSQGFPSAIGKSETERRLIDVHTTVGVWDESEGPELKRKNVLRLGFGAHQEDQVRWYCSFADSTIMIEWMKQIKALAIIARAERTGIGASIRQAHEAGRIPDLELEYTMQTRGLRSFPSASVSRLPAAVTRRDPFFPLAFESPTPDDPDQFREKMMAKGHSFDSPSAQPPLTMVDIFNQSIPSGDLAQIEHADYAHRLQLAEELRRNEAHKHHPAAIAKATHAAVSKMAQQNQVAIERGMRGLGIGSQAPSPSAEEDNADSNFGSEGEPNPQLGEMTDRDGKDSLVEAPARTSTALRESASPQRSSHSRPEFRDRVQTSRLPPLPLRPTVGQFVSREQLERGLESDERGRSYTLRPILNHPPVPAFRTPLTSLSGRPNPSQRHTTGFNSSGQQRYTYAKRPSNATQPPAPQASQSITPASQSDLIASSSRLEYPPIPSEGMMSGPTPSALSNDEAGEPPFSRNALPRAIVTHPTPQHLAHAREESGTLPEGMFAMSMDTASVGGSDHSGSGADGSSSGKRKTKILPPAMDLMAEMSVRPDMNYEQVTERISESASGRQSDNGRSIRFDVGQSKQHLSSDHDGLEE